jgi:uncharacterized membrane protein YadS
VHDVGQVVATAQTAGAAALAVAVVVKLTRVLMLAPMVAIASIQTRRRGSHTSSSRPAIVPLFIVGFVAAVLARSFLPVPDAVLAIADLVQSALLACALFGIGASLRLEQLARSGVRALAAGLVAWVVILALALTLIYLP